MKTAFILMAGITMLISCNSSDQGGTVNDGIREPGDASGALKDSQGIQYDPSVDTSIGDNRVDTEKRDSLNRK